MPLTRRATAALVFLRLTLGCGWGAESEYARVVEDILASAHASNGKLMRITLLSLPSSAGEKLVEINVAADGSATIRCAAVQGKPIHGQLDRLTRLAPEARKRAVDVVSNRSTWPRAQSRDEIAALGRAYRQGVAEVVASAAEVLDSDLVRVTLDGTAYRLSIEVAAQRSLQLGFVAAEPGEDSANAPEFVRWSVRILSQACRVRDPRSRQ